MIICRQTINFILHVFLEVLQRYRELVILGTLVCLNMHTQSDTINLQKTFVFICRQKINFIPHTFLERFQRHANLLFWVFSDCLATHTQNDTINLQNSFVFICRQKINFIPHVFLEILQRYGNYFRYFGHAWLGPPSQEHLDSINLYKTSMFMHTKGKFCPSLLS